MSRDSERIFDEYLVAAAVTGDGAALARLAARWQPRLLRHAWRVLGDVERARDVVQEAWVDILRGLIRLDDVAAFPAWAYRIVSRRCQRTAASTAAGVDMPRDPADRLDETVPGHSPGELAAELSIVIDAIGTLTPVQRAALSLFYIEELTVAEIAIATDVAPGTVKTRLMHARRKVRALLEGNSDGQV